MREEIVFGDRMMDVELPDTVMSAPPGLSTTLSPLDDIEGEVRSALQRPLGRVPLSEMAKPNWKVTIAFDDPTVPCFAPVWEPAIKLVIQELRKAGVKKSNITLLCANALHRKFTRRELARIIGEDESIRVDIEAALVLVDLEPEQVLHPARHTLVHGIPVDIEDAHPLC